jgi:hypothetical protein
MKKIVALILMSTSVALWAQRQKGELDLSVGVGSSLLLEMPNYGDAMDVKKIPVYTAALDYAVLKKISIGATVSYQKFTGEVKDYGYYVYTNGVQEYKTESFSTSLSQFSAGARLLVHFGHRLAADKYFGIRAGMRSVNFSSTARDRHSTSVDLKSGGEWQFIFYGVRGHLTPKLSYNWEFALATPYWITAGLTYRFNGDGFFIE